ncbi:MAG: amino acid permease [Candidatus Bathyarchaeia archaeon]
MASSKVFVRNATGFVREFGALDALLFSSAMVFALIFTTVQFAWFYGNTGGANLPLSLVVAAIPFIFLMVAYWVMAIVMPRTGNDYVWVGRIFHPAIGFAWGLVYMFIVLFVAFVGAGVAPFSYAFSISLTSLGLIGNSPSLTNLGSFLGGSVGTIELSILLTVLFGMFSIFGSRFIKGLMYGSWIAAVVGILLMWYILATVNPQTFSSNWNTLLVPSFGNNATYQALQSSGQSAGFTASPPGFASIVVALPLASLFLLGGNYTNAFVGEIKNVKKSIPIALFLSLLFGIIYWSITSTLTLNAVGANWMYAVGYAFDNGKFALPFPPSQPLMLAVAAYPNTALIYLMFITYLLGSLAPIFAYFWIASKYMFAWAFDRVIPSKFADISERFRTPHLSIIAVVVLGILSEVVYFLLGWSGSFTMGTVIWDVSYVVPGLALAIFPFVKKDLFSQSPGFVRWKLAGLPVVSIVGIITAIAFAWEGYLGFITPAAAVPTQFGYYLTASVIILAFVIYFASWAYHKRQGLDLSLALKTIPPE